MAKEYVYDAPQQVSLDTLLKPAEVKNDTVNKVSLTHIVPLNKKIEYRNQIDNYGFKNLFKNFSYNPAMPYSSQVNPNAEVYMKDYLQAHGDYLQRLKTTSVLKFNFIDNILSQYRLPTELKYLAVIESNLNANALSWVGARGPWQFMSYTATGYGLRVNSVVDERIDYFKSTHAAAKYLLSLYKDLKDWLLVIAAYNGGPGRVHSAIRKSGSRNFWALQHYLPTESKNHVKKFIATHYIMEATNNANNNTDYPGLHTGNTEFKTFLSKDEEANTDTLSISGRYNAAIIAKNISMDIAAFNRYNPNFDPEISSGVKYILRLPVDKMRLFMENKYSILGESVQALLNTVNVTHRMTYPDKKVKKKN